MQLRTVAKCSTASALLHFFTPPWIVHVLPLACSSTSFTA